MRNLTRLLLLLVLAAFGWGLYWFIGARATERGLTAWLDARRADGWTAQAASLATEGFPNRFDTTFEALELSDPDTRLGWSAPWFQILSLSYKPTHVIAAWPTEQELRLDGDVVGIASGRMIGSLEFAAAPALPLERLVLEAEMARFDGSRGWKAAVDAAQLALRENPGAADEPVYDLAISLDRFTPDSAEVRRLRDLAGLPAVIETLTAQATIGFDKGWDMSAVEDRRPQPRDIAITALDARWGDLALAGSGALSVDAGGVASGQIDLEANNWRDILALAVAAGALSDTEGALAETALETIARLSGDPERLDVALRFSGGRLLIGPVPLGPAPRFVLP